MGIYGTVFDHHGKIRDGHVCHTAVAMATVNIIPEQVIVFVRDFCFNLDGNQIGTLAQGAALGTARAERVDGNADGNASRATVAIGKIGNMLAAPKTATEHVVNHAGGAVRRQVSEQFALKPFFQVRTRLF